MTTEIKKVWFVDGQIIEQEIPEADIYKQEPVAWISKNAGLYHGKPDESLNPLPLYLAPPPCPTCEALARTVMLDQTSYDNFKPDWDTEAVLVEEQQRMAKRIEELEAMPKEVDVKHKTKYYALLKEYDRVCYLLDKATDKITDQDLMLAIQTARIVDLQTHIENLEGEE